jgi:hypothetical protein
MSKSRRIMTTNGTIGLEVIFIEAVSPLVLEEKEDWLGGLDSNQDSQIQSLESYQLDDLPAGRNKKESQHLPGDRDSHDSPLLI